MAKKLDETHLEGLMTLLAVARSGRFTAAAAHLGVNHSTVSRRLSQLEDALGGRLLVRGAHGWEVTALGARAMQAAEGVERAMQGLIDERHEADGGSLHGLVRVGAPDAYVVHIAMPALSWLQRREPALDIEVVAATQQVRQRRSGVDIEVVVGRPLVNRAVTAELFSYELRLYATPEYLEREGVPMRVADLAEHRVNYYIESALQVDELDVALQRIPQYRTGINSTSVFAHVAATLAGAGIGLLPDYVARRTPQLVEVLPGDFAHPVSYWAALREENDRNPAVGACLLAMVSYAASDDFAAAGQTPADAAPRSPEEASGAM